MSGWSGKFLDNLEGPNNLESSRIAWNISGLPGKVSDNLDIFGMVRKSFGNPEKSLENLESFQII